MSASFTLNARDVDDSEDGWLSITGTVDVEINVTVDVLVSFAEVLKGIFDDVPWSRLEFVGGHIPCSTCDDRGWIETVTHEDICYARQECDCGGVRVQLPCPDCVPLTTEEDDDAPF